MTETGNVLYTAKTHTIGDRQNGASRSWDGRLDIRLAPPGSTGIGTNPEQLFAAGWSACFHGAMGLAAHRMKVALPPDTTIDVEVDLCMANGSYFLRARHTRGWVWPSRSEKRHEHRMDQVLLFLVRVERAAVGDVAGCLVGGTSCERVERRRSPWS